MSDKPEIPNNAKITEKTFGLLAEARSSRRKEPVRVFAWRPGKEPLAKRAARIVIHCLVVFGAVWIFVLSIAEIHISRSPDMRLHVARFWHHWWSAFTSAVGSNSHGFTLTLFEPLVLLVTSFLALLFFLGGWKAMKQDKVKAIMGAFALTFTAQMILFGPTFTRKGIDTIYQDHQELIADNKKLKKQNESLLREVEQKKQNLAVADPAFHNMTGTIRAFMIYRRDIGPDATCRILVTSPDGYNDMFLSFITFAVFGSNCPNGNLQNIGIKPEKAEAEENKGIIPGVIVLHAPPGAKGADRLTDNLSNLFQVKRVYTLPASAPENTIWLQFGPQTVWNSQLFARKGQ